MVMDRNNRSHKPKGTPDGGRFETGDTGGASGDVAAPGMDPATCLTVRGFDDANRRMGGWRAWRSRAMTTISGGYADGRPRSTDGRESTGTRWARSSPGAAI